MSDLHREHNDLKTAAQHLLTSQTLGELAGLPQNPYRWCAALARIRVAQGDLDGALDLLDQAERLYDANFPRMCVQSRREDTGVGNPGRFGEALGWAREQGLTIENELQLPARVRSHHPGQGAPGPLSERPRRPLHSRGNGTAGASAESAEEGGRKGSTIGILVLQAIAYHAQGDLSAALLPLQHALALAEPEGYVRMFLDEGSSMMQLLREASAREIMPDYTDKLWQHLNLRSGKAKTNLIYPLPSRKDTGTVSPLLTH